MVPFEIAKKFKKPSEIQKLQDNQEPQEGKCFGYIYVMKSPNKFYFIFIIDAVQYKFV